MSIWKTDIEKLLLKIGSKTFVEFLLIVIIIVVIWASYDKEFLNLITFGLLE